MVSPSRLASHKLQKILHTLVYNVLSLAVDILVWHVKSKDNLNCDNCQWRVPWKLILNNANTKIHRYKY